ncbi:TetR/AcrR family transcriptional regulator [Antrihabitans sp. NCIMB 15449]|uniref:TetR/AcrR family transcriptional regulator n=2 Tax=Antrihabitans spumae TaxID=3373370 RepID=A0ABW7JP38_9NOCA
MVHQQLTKSRRERRRLETYDEIVEVSRLLLREKSELSLRAVATQMGMTPPSLYRYVASVDGMRAIVARDIKRDIVSAMSKASDHYPTDDPAARLAASATMFRIWALANRAEFQMAFANPADSTCSIDTADEPLPEVGPAGASPAFADHFADLFIRLHSQGLPFEAPADDLESVQTRDPERMSADPFHVALGAEGLAPRRLFNLAWARLYGIVMVEVSGHIDEHLIRSGSVFTTLLRETFASLGLADRWDQIIKISRETASRASI